MSKKVTIATLEDLSYEGVDKVKVLEGNKFYVVYPRDMMTWFDEIVGDETPYEVLNTYKSNGKKCATVRRAQ